MPMEAMDSTNLSRTGNGDFPSKYVVVRSLVQGLNANSREALQYVPKLWFTCNEKELRYRSIFNTNEQATSPYTNNGFSLILAVD